MDLREWGEAASLGERPRGHLSILENAFSLAAGLGA